MERVNKGEKYWILYMDRFGIYPIKHRDTRHQHDDLFFATGNYFNTEEEAEAMAEKIRKVLKGADVIEMPSEKEIEDAMNTSVTESIMSISPYGEFTLRATDLLECAWLKGAEWLKSKIVK